MKNLLFTIIVATVIILALTGACFKISSLTEENKRLKSNQEILFTENQVIMAESQKYRVSDSLNAATISELELTLKEYKQYRNKDLKLIEQLKTGKSDLQKIIGSQSETINILHTKLDDSIRINIANQVDTLKCFDYKSKWADIKGCIDLKKDSINLQINSRESLKIVETITYKRFLGFLWKTSKIKNRQVSVVSENPNTEIMNCEYISIKQ